MAPFDKISQYFTLQEAIGSATAERRKINNYPDEATLARIAETARKMDSVRRFLGVPIVVTSWYRSPALNKAIGSKPTSQHVKGEAVDWVAPQFGPPAHIFKRLREAGLIFDQLILEYADGYSGGWIHSSFTDAPRQQALVIDTAGARVLA